MSELLSQPWPWYVGGPLVGLMLPILLLIDNRAFGISSSLKHMCAAVAPVKTNYFSYDWKQVGGWNLAFVVGVFFGGLLSHSWLRGTDPVAISDATRADIESQFGLVDFSGLVPAELFNWATVLSPAGLVIFVIGGFLIGFGTRYAGGCTSGHAISGLSDFQLPSLIAVVGFFFGGLLATHLLLPLLLGGVR